jgi:MoxR-like ATPase
MTYKKIFDPTAPPAAAPPGPRRAPSRAGDLRDGEVYVYEDEIVLAVNVALATGRPLLLYGPPGSGKSSLAPHVARRLGWRYHAAVITSRTQARDLLYRFDAVRRLGDAQTEDGINPNPAAYVEPAALWWAFDRRSARRRGTLEGEGGVPEAVEPNRAEQPDRAEAVVLLDEIDKADPDVPNNLLVPLGSYTFRVHELERDIKVGATPLLFITTNDERELPRAFVRRCVTLTLKAPTRDRLVEIAEAHFGPGHRKLYEEVSRLVAEEEERARARKLPAPSTAEYLDAVSACRRLKVVPGKGEWERIFSMVLRKRAEGADGK